jgi:ABC-2 type transport system permease protein
MINSMRAELAKLWRRPAVRILIAAWIAMSVFFGYVLPYLLLGSDSAEFGVDLRDILPIALIENQIQGFPSFGFAIALVLGGLAAGSEYGWKTVATTLVQGPSRVGLFIGKLAALEVVLLVLIVAGIAVSAVAAAVIAAAESASGAWPNVSEILRGIGAAWLILSVGLGLGVAAAILLRNTGASIGIGLVYVLVIEGLLSGFAPASGLVSNIAKALPGINAGGLANGFVPPTEFGETAFGVGSLVSPTQGAWVLVAYAVGLGLLATLRFSRRDVTA